MMSLEGDDGLPEEPEEHVSHDAWVIPYADLLTLLMAMFIALFAMSTVDVTKFKAFSIGFNEALGGGKLDAGVGGTGNATSTQVGRTNGEGPLNGATLMPAKPVTNQSQMQTVLSAIASDKAQAARQRQALENVQRQIDDAAKRLGFGGQVRTKQLKNGLQVTL